MPYFVAMGTRGERLKQARKAHYRTARDAARALTIPYSTYAGHENGSRQFEADEAVVYARKFKVGADWLLYGKTATILTPAKTPLATIPVIGIVRAGFWQDADAGDHGVYEAVPSAPDNPPEWQYAYTVEGTSLNRVASPGSILICLDIIKAHYDVKDGDLVIVERKRFGGQMIERTAKRLRRAADGTFELWPDSTDPAYQEPVKIDGIEDGDSIEIIAKVLWIMHRP